MQELNQQMKKDLQNWQANVSSSRKTLYALNYFTCLQLLRISSELYHLITNPNHEVNHEMLLLLMSLSPNLTAKEIKQVTSKAEAQSIALRSLPSLTPPTDHNESSYFMNEIDVPGEIEKLNEEEKEIYFSSVQDYEFNPQMVLAAIHQFGSDEEEVLQWCFDPKNAEAFKSKPIITEDSVEHKPEIDISNTTVQELIDLEFSELLSIEAVNTCGEDLDKCLDYCTKSTAEHANFGDNTHDEICDNVLLETDASYESETKDTSSSGYVI